VKSALRLLLALCLLVQNGEAQNAQVRVLTAGPGWSADGRALQRGGIVPAGADLTGREASGLLLECPSGWIAYSCRNGNCAVRACEMSGTGVEAKAVQIATAGLSVGISGLRAAADALFRREARDPIIAAARAGGNPGDAVVLQDDRGVHWGPALSRVLEGRYCFRVTPLPAAAATATTFVLDWDRSRDRDGVAPVPGLAPGLYALQKGRGDNSAACEPDPDSTTAWVLVAPGADFERINTGWRNQTIAIAELEASGADAAVVRTIRHAVLSGLAESL
jgi:hypothetical protein